MIKYYLSLLTACLLCSPALDARTYVGRDGQLYYDVNSQEEENTPVPEAHRESYEYDVIYDSQESPERGEKDEGPIEDRPIGPQYFPPIQRSDSDELKDDSKDEDDSEDPDSEEDDLDEEYTE